jgi:hypothetical protein
MLNIASIYLIFKVISLNGAYIVHIQSYSIEPIDTVFTYST